MAVENAPADVAEFIPRRASCNHFFGEYAYDEERRIFLENTLAELRCDGLDTEAARLRQRYANDADVLWLLEETADYLGW